MPTATLHPCRRCGAGIPRAQQWCPDCTPQEAAADARHRGSARERGYTWRWQKYRAMYLRRHPLCALCLDAGRTTLACVVDHIVDHKGDPHLFWNPENHRALCRPCHDARTDAGDFGRPVPPPPAPAALP